MQSFHEVVVNEHVVVLNMLDELELLNGCTKDLVIGSVMYDQEHDELYNLFIDIKRRNKGHAEALLKEAISRYSPKHITASTAYGSDILRLMRLYDKVGFKTDNIRLTRKI